MKKGRSKSKNFQTTFPVMSLLVCMACLFMSLFVFFSRYPLPLLLPFPPPPPPLSPTQVLLMSEGSDQLCPDKKKRKSFIKFICAVSEEIISSMETDKCVYTFQVGLRVCVRGLCSYASVCVDVYESLCYSVSVFIFMWMCIMIMRVCAGVDVGEYQ